MDLKKISKNQKKSSSQNKNNQANIIINKTQIEAEEEKTYKKLKKNKNKEIIVSIILDEGNKSILEKYVEIKSKELEDIKKEILYINQDDNYYIETIKEKNRIFWSSNKNKIKEEKI